MNHVYNCVACSCGQLVTKVDNLSVCDTQPPSNRVAKI